MKRLVLTLLAAAAFCAPAYAADQEPACGTVLAPKPCASFTTGVVTVATIDQKREFATVGGAFDAPLGAGFSASANVDVFGVQDGGALDGLSAARSFRVVKAEASVGKAAGAFRFNAVGAVTFSIEGQRGAPIDPRLWDALAEVELRLEEGGHLAIRGGHSGPAGGWAVAADVEIPVATGPAIVARYELPLQRDRAGALPWVITAGVRVRVKSFRLHF